MEPQFPGSAPATDQVPQPPAARPRRRRVVVLTATLAAAAAIGAVLFQPASLHQASAAAPATHRDTATTKLICSGHGTVTSNTPITNTPHNATVSASGTIDKCIVKDGGPTDLVTGTATFTGTASNASCTGLGTFTGTGTINWFDANGKPQGTTTATTNGSQEVEGDPAHNEIVNEPDATVSLTSTHFAGGTVTGSGFPTSDISTCSTNGLTSVSGQFELRFNTVL